MEADSKNKKGRPNVFKRNGVDRYKNVLRDFFPEYEERGLVNHYYFLHGFNLAEEVFGKEKAKKLFLTERERFKNKGILEQIGRMSLQNYYDDESCQKVLKQAVDLLNDGFKVKDVEQRIRNFRNGY